MRRLTKHTLEGHLQTLCADHWLYRSTVRAVKTELSKLSLMHYSAEELWADCIKELDSFRRGHTLYKTACQLALLDFYNELLHRQPDSEPYREECRKLTALFIAMLLLLFSKIEGLSVREVVLSIMLQGKRMTLPVDEALTEVRCEMWRTGEEEFTAQLRAYVEGDDYLSDEIDRIMEEWSAGANSASPQGMGWPRAEGLPRAEGKPMVEAVADMREPSLRIGYKKLSRALIVLDAMIQKGWIVDKEGNRPSNRDAALNEILQLAFGEEKARQISSTMYPSHIPREEHEEYREQIINELLELTSKRAITH